MTAQLPEILVHRGQRFGLRIHPLYEYLGRIKKSKRPRFKRLSADCERGYIGWWEILDGKLYLTDLEGLVEGEDGQDIPVNLKTAMPWVKDKLAANWVSRSLFSDFGRIRQYVPRTYEREHQFDFDKGRLIDEYVILNPPVPEAIYYKIEADGSRHCVEKTTIWTQKPAVIPDPLEGEDLKNAWKIWNRYMNCES